ncbi:hypothetical protein KOW79_007273 [Hemibagrus wyckioides]|uniref:Uncharacterized protein n=1 Tax=Hemibagrus wyckioides TaxID=337641 RepID=A0A9D3NVQ9_9TELE|nr:hypothetical protein KOW79_007273 [Hemibagrus wyckioides]
MLFSEHHPDIQQFSIPAVIPQAIWIDGILSYSCIHQEVKDVPTTEVQVAGQTEPIENIYFRSVGRLRVTGRIRNLSRRNNCGPCLTIMISQN